ncbi:MAG: hypothetical protein A2W99_02690 [Bacteroidetes bacterium GWF2_33_16]|nr:MAG: hypothetical protein A2X00_07905 [Bacteroidetes bacterium GWE2_32_14]OFY07374.1 MAG: hypothetical protein A2W99_02690 [Bacteroidetes bacterium GWF2_33_16]
MNFKCIIIDDEPLSINLVKKHLASFKQFDVVGDFENAIDASVFLQKNTVDLIFLDIQMPEISGIDFIKSLHKVPSIIIISAYKEFAMDGFELDVVDFLLKPVTFNRFFKAINKFLAFSFKAELPENNIVRTEIKGHEYADLFVKDTNKTYRINPVDIYYIEGMREYIKIYTNQDNIITKCSLNNFLKRLPEELFIRSHKSYIINRKKVKAFTTSTIEINNKKIPISRSYKLQILNILNSSD